MKFDIILGNPPYQITNGAANATTIWPKFVVRAFDLCKSGGFVSLVHPGSWRGGDPKSRSKDVKQLLTKYNTTYINMNDKDQGLDTFKAATSYDYYVCEKVANKGKTKLVGYDKTDTVVTDLADWRFLPAGNFDTLSKLFTNKPEEAVTVIKDYTYPTNNTKKPYSKKRDGVYKYPLFYTKTQQGGVKTYWSPVKQDGVHFGQPKVIMSTGTADPYIDWTGEYGLTEWPCAIVAPKEELQDIYDALVSPEFNTLLDGCRSTSHRYEPRIIKSLRRDFYNYL